MVHLFGQGFLQLVTVEVSVCGEKSSVQVYLKRQQLVLRLP